MFWRIKMWRARRKWLKGWKANYRLESLAHEATYWLTEVQPEAPQEGCEQ